MVRKEGIRKKEILRLRCCRVDRDVITWFLTVTFFFFCHRYAPESLRDGRFSHYSDVWSYGVTLYEMFSLGEDPTLPCCSDDVNQSQLLTALEGGARLPCPPTCPQLVYVKVISPCWKLDSKERPTFTMIFDKIQKIRLWSIFFFKKII